MFSYFLLFAVLGQLCKSDAAVIARIGGIIVVNDPFVFVTVVPKTFELITGGLFVGAIRDGNDAGDHHVASHEPGVFVVQRRTDCRGGIVGGGFSLKRQNVVLKRFVDVVSV